MADPFRSFSGKPSSPPHTASSDADPFLVALPDRDSISIFMDETPLPVPDEIPDADEITEEEVASIGADASAEQTPEATADVPGDVPGDPQTEPLAESLTATPENASSGENEGSPDTQADADERECFMGVLCLPKNITLIGHWAHEVKLGNMSGRTVMGVLAAGCVFALILVLLAAFFRNDSMRGILNLL